jgi:sigma-E factor negative regulatory protein RseA
VIDDGSAERMMERIDDKRELISALADGQLAGEAFARGVELAAADDGARQAWHTYHLIGDVLRSSELARCAPPDRFLSRLQQRLRDEEVVVETQAQVVVQQRREAANDGVFRWKLVAGVASIAAVSAIAWTVIGVGPGKDAQAPQLAAASVPAGTVLTGTTRGVMIRDPRLDEFLAAHRQLGAATLVAPAGYLRNATFDGQGR